MTDFAGKSYIDAGRLGIVGRSRGGFSYATNAVPALEKLPTLLRAIDNSSPSAE